MNSQNLIPVKRLQVKRQRRAARRWLIGDGLYLGVLIVAGCVTAALALETKPDSSSDSIRAELARSNTSLVSLKKSAASVNAILQANSELSDNPDWSTLLVAISDSLGDEMVLTRVGCVMPPSLAGRGGAPGTSPLSLQVSGMGRSQERVTQFILRLEQLHFFRGVRLVQTAPQILNGNDVISFELICDLPGSAK